MVVPMTFEPEKEGGFMLNIWHKSPILVPARSPARVKWSFFLPLDVHWSSPESGDLWYTSGGTRVAICSHSGFR